MSRERRKGTGGESRALPLVKTIWPDASRTAGDHSTEWGKADYKHTGEYVVEVKNWSHVEKAVSAGWKQVLETAQQTGKKPLLIVLFPRRPIEKALWVGDYKFMQEKIS